MSHPVSATASAPIGGGKASPSESVSFGLDLVPGMRILEVLAVRAPFARATVTACDPAPALGVSECEFVLTARDLPGERVLAGEWEGLPVLADGEISHFHQAVGLVAARCLDGAVRAASALEIAYQPLPPVLGLEEAVAVRSFHGGEASVMRGDPAKAIGASSRTVVGTFEIGGRELGLPEPEWAWAQADGEDGIIVTAPTANPAALHAALASVLALPMNAVRVQVPARRACAGLDPLPALHAALVTRMTGRPARVLLTAEETRRLAPRGGGARVCFDAGFESDGRVAALDLSLFLDGGFVPTDGEGMLAGLLAHLDGVYQFPELRLSARLCRTHLPSRSPSPGELAALAQLAVGEIVARVARVAGILPEVVRQRNFLAASAGSADGNPPRGAESAVGVPMDITAMLGVWKSALRDSDFAARRKNVDAWNARNPLVKRGLAAVPTKLALGNPRAGAMLSHARLEVLADASVRIECGAGNDATRQAVVFAVSAETGARLVDVRVVTGTGSAGAGGGSAELEVEAARDAARKWQAELLPLILRIFHENGATGVEAGNLEFADGRISDRLNPNLGFSFESLVRFALAQGVGLSAEGFASTPHFGLPYDGYYFGTAVAEVQVESFSGGVRLLRADLFQESGGGMIPPPLARADLRARFMEGVGWLTTEIAPCSREGDPLGDPPSNAILAPGLDEDPDEFRAVLIDSPERRGDAAAGGHALALGVREAIRDAVSAFGNGQMSSPAIELPVPSTPESVFRLIQQQRASTG